MSTPTCGNCHFFDAETSRQSNETGLCRYNPPVAKSTSESAWPVVDSKDWCGHFNMTAERFVAAAE